MRTRISQSMNPTNFSLAITCLLWLSKAPGFSCVSSDLYSRQVHIGSELDATQQPLLNLSESHVSPSRRLEKRKKSKKTKKKKDPVPPVPNTRNNVAVPGGADNKNPPQNGDPNDPQNSLNLSPQAVQAASKNPGKEKPEQAPSLTSPNNFINFCISGAGKLGNAVIMNGAQTKKANTCNGIPMGMIPAPDKTPSLRIFSPKNMDTVPAKKTFNILIGVKNLDAGHFTAPLETYYSAPTQLNGAAIVIGHTHVVAQRIDSLTSTSILDPLKFAFFKGIDTGVDKDGKLKAEVKDGLEKGVYRLSTMTAGSNHQPIGLALAQHDSIDDMIYITVN
ncbi:hypothetical protein DFH28DRAFT_417775 [Melampsora americana]|nr:hypothetical protein DFH28DRAFT_417775 [Melampsora americana]